MKVRFVGRLAETTDARLKFGQELQLSPAEVAEIINCRAPLVTEEDWIAAGLTREEHKLGWRCQTEDFKMKAAALMAASSALLASIEGKEN